MSDPITFDPATPRYGLPNLYTGQAQKEFFVNEAHALTDALLHCTIEGQASTPPVQPADGENWLVDSAPQQDWLGQAGKLACRQSGQWLFVVPHAGLRVFNRATGQDWRFDDTWHVPATPALPVGGSVIDAEVRETLASLIAALRVAGIFPEA